MKRRQFMRQGTMSGPRRSSESESTQRRHALILSTWKPLLPLTVFAFLVFYDSWVCTPSCNIVPAGTGADPAGQYDVGESQNPDDLKVMIVANLLLLGSEAGFFDLYFREYYLSKYFRKSFDSLKPDMLLVLGDVSARGSELTKTKWVSVLYQFHRVLGPFLELPYHVVLGDRDVGQCSGLDTNSVHRIARSFPGLDSAGCGAFEISNVSFVSLNAVALLCGNNKLRFSVERVIETESSDMRMDLDGAKEGTGDSREMGDDPEKIKIGIEGTSNSSQWRKNVMESGSGPVLLLHFPLHRWPTNNGCQEIDIPKKAANPRQQSSEALDNWGFTDTGPYELLHTVPPNDTEYIFQALKPRIVFSAHTHAFCDHTHSDGTREVTVPAMTWKVKDDPGFIVATFHSDRNAISVSYCSLARESHLLIAYTSLLVLLLTPWLVTNTRHFKCLR